MKGKYLEKKKEIYKEFVDARLKAYADLPVRGRTQKNTSTGAEESGPEEGEF